MLTECYRSGRRLLGGDSDELARWVRGEEGVLFRYGVALGAIVAGAGAYGATIGLWRSGEQAVYAAAKFPLVVLLTCGGNAVLNGVLAQVLATGLTWRQTSLALLTSFAVASLALLAFVPVALFLLWNTPPLGSAGDATGHSVTLLAHVGMIAYAGWVGSRRLYGVLGRVAPSVGSAQATLLAWLAGNLLLGSQVSWILRPFVGNPRLPVEFLREHPLHGGFYEQVWRSLSQLLF